MVVNKMLANILVGIYEPYGCYIESHRLRHIEEKLLTKVKSFFFCLKELY